MAVADVRESDTGRPPRWPSQRAIGWIALLVFLSLALLAGQLPLWTVPAVVPASAPAAEFSAERAMADLEAIAKAPRPLGSAENARVRDYLVTRASALGLEAEIQETAAVSRFPGATAFAAGTIRNVVVRIPGTDSSGAVLLSGHYDAASTGPGASDCGSCVVTLLEAMRAVKAGPPLKNDVVFVFADGEENQDLGAAAFVAEHPLFRDVRVALNWESMAAGGPSVMYYTGGGNAWLVDEFARSAPLPLASSFLTSLLRLFPSQQLGCDLDEYLAGGAQGLGFVLFSEDIPVYHTMRDSVANVDPRSVQHDGLYALSAVRHFGSLDLSSTPRESDAVFFNVLPGVLLSYPTALALPLAAALSALFVGVAVLGFRRRRLTAGGLVLGALVLPLGAGLLVALAGVAWSLVRAANPNLQVFLFGNQSGLYLLGLTGLVVAGGSAVYLGLGRRARVENLSVGALLVWALLAVTTAAAAPAMSYLFTWPALGALAALGWLFSRRTDPTPVSAALALGLGAVPALILVPQSVGLLAPLFVRLDAMTTAEGLVPLLEVPLLLVALLVGLLAPHLAWLGDPSGCGRPSRRGWLVPIAALSLAVAATGLATARSGFSAGFPRPTSIAYVLDADTGQATWLSAERERDPWSAEFALASAGSGAEGFPFLGLRAFAAPAPAVDLAPPEATLVSDTTADGLPSVKLRLTSARGAEAMEARVDLPGELVGGTLQGKPLDIADLGPEERRTLALTYTALPRDGIELVLQLRQGGPIRVTVADGSTGLPSIPGVRIGPRPPDLVPIPGPSVLDPTVVRRAFTFS